MPELCLGLSLAIWLLSIWLPTEACSKKLSSSTHSALVVQWIPLSQSPLNGSLLAPESLVICSQEQTWNLTPRIQFFSFLLFAHFSWLFYRGVPLGRALAPPLPNVAAQAAPWLSAADMYLNSPRGSNNKLREQSNNAPQTARERIREGASNSLVGGCSYIALIRQIVFTLRGSYGKS